MSSLQDQEFTFMKMLWTSSSWQSSDPAKEILLEMLTTAICKKERSSRISSALSHANAGQKCHGMEGKGSAHRDFHSGKKQNETHSSCCCTQNLGQHEPSDDQLQTLASMFEWPGHVADTSTVRRKNPLNENEQKQFVSGRQLYLTTCAGCHGSDGRGQPRFAPTLIGSDWVSGDERRLALILLHGMEGPIHVKGKRYDAPEILPVMPSHSTMDDADIASILTYIRNEWGNAGGAVSRRTRWHDLGLRLREE